MSAMVRGVGEAVHETHFAISGLDLVRVFSKPRKLVSKLTLSPHSCSAELGSGDRAHSPRERESRKSGLVGPGLGLGWEGGSGTPVGLRPHTGPCRQQWAL